MTASSAIIPGHNYHIKLVIADLYDTVYDSAIFIEAGSFSTGPPVCSDKVQLVAFVDANNNGIKDSAELNFNYGSFVSQQNNTGPITNTATPSGTYTIYDTTATTYDFGYSINPEYSPYFAVSPTAFNDITIAANPNQVLYFPITLTQTYNDVMVSIIPMMSCMPGFGYYNKIIYRNLGIATTSGSLTFTKDPLLTISNIYQSGTVATTDGFTYEFNNLGPFESRYIYVQLAVPTLPTVNIGEVLTNSATITAPSNDVNLTNNSFTSNQIVGASYDPNDKMESHGEKIPFNQFAPSDYLYYTIRFQNTGTSDALTIRITDTLDAKLDETSVSMVDASHDYVLERVNNLLTWKFNYINLVGALENEELSKGYVTFKIKLKPGFAVGDIVPNKARIYFDTNPAIITNTFNTEFVQSLQNPSFTANTITLYPNPATNAVQITNSLNETITNLALYEVSGKLVKQLTETNHSQITVDLQTLAKGLYFVEITTASNTKQIKKLIIQ
jgi:fimbrial isopeptide formation D2 family protein